MGLIITTEITTDSGTTSSAYINVDRIDISKERDTKVFLNLYLSKQAREDNYKETALSKSVIKMFKIKPDELDLSAIYSDVYMKLKAILEESGLTVEDDI
jgi:hypothetical protein